MLFQKDEPKLLNLFIAGNPQQATDYKPRPHHIKSMKNIQPLSQVHVS